MTVIAHNRYGKAEIRLVKVERGENGDALADLTIDVQLEGAFEPLYAGDNSACIATDTMKNTVYALARREPIGGAEAFAMRIADHFIQQPAVSVVRVRADEHPWSHIHVGRSAHPHAFVRSGSERWTVRVSRTAHITSVTSGIADLIVMKTAGSAFSGFPRDAYTTLPETEDRLLATSVTAEWMHAPGIRRFDSRDRIRRALVEAFATHESRSVQHTLAAMGEAALQAADEIVEISLALPNRHHLL